MYAVSVEARRRRLTPGAEIEGSYELPNIVTGSETWVLCKSSKHSKLLSHLSDPSLLYFLLFLNQGHLLFRLGLDLLVNQS